MLLAGLQKSDMGNFPDDVEIGPHDAKIKLTLVANPLCGSCWTAFRQMEALIHFGHGQIKGNIRFLLWLGDEEKSPAEKFLDYEVSALILSLAQAGNRQGARDALSDWFSSGEGFTKRKFNKWSGKYVGQCHNERKKVEKSLRLHYEWAMKASIRATPTIFLNSIKLPMEIQFEDLKYLLLRQIEG